MLVFCAVFLSVSGIFALGSWARSGGWGDQDGQVPEAVAKRHISPNWNDPRSAAPTTSPSGSRASSASASPSVSPSKSPAKPSSSASPAPGKKPAATSTTKATEPATDDGVASVGGNCALPRYPTAACTGVPAGWKPKRTTNGDLTITKNGTVVEDRLVTGSIIVRAADVTIRNTRVYGSIDNFHGNEIYGHTRIEDTEVVNPPGQEYSQNDQYAFGVANYTCLRCKVINRLEGFRVGAADYSGAGSVLIQDSFAQLAVPPGMCASSDPHGDGLQAYGGPKVTLRHNTIDQRRDDCPTAPVFIPDQGNAGGTVVDNVLAGGGYALRLTGGKFAAVTGNKIVQGSFAYGPVEISCSLVSEFSGNATVKYDFATGKVTGQVKAINEC
ncbi:hypothetical protein [Actinoplanes sp. DH11]|uniref:hypothetical protein n=1 Tax=Actinoplanes sp. DH11 TaxID=2857011 RepID=UPI001E5E39F3|nr:hypothetical protein [Actinoplanes sp. DH11]